MTAITPNVLSQVCAARPETVKLAQARDAVEALGWLAPYWLDRRVLQQAAELSPGLEDSFLCPDLPGTHGTCLLAFVNEHPEDWRLLDQALLLPVCWEPDRCHSALLPGGLVRVADEVLAALHKVSGVKDRAWGLQLSPPLGVQDRDLARLPVEAPSAWVPLAAGLLLRVAGLEPNPLVWSTGAWDKEFGVISVKGVAQKLRLARRFRIRDFFIPNALAVEARDALEQLGGGPTPRYLPAVVKDPRKEPPDPEKALTEYLAWLGKPPQRSDSPFEARQKYYNLQRTGDGAADYYWEHLLPDVVAARRQQLEDLFPGWCPSHFVTVVSGSHELAAIGPLASGAGQCLLLHTAKYEKECRQVQAHLARLGPRCTPGLFDDRKPIDQQFHTLLASFVAGLKDAALLAIDLTPGTKEMSWSLEAVAPQGSALLYLRHDFRRDKKADPGSEFYTRRWAGEPSVPRLTLPI